MSVSTEFSTALYEDSQQFTSGNLSHFKITFKNRDPNDHMRFAGTLEEGDNLRKGVRYVVISLADDDRNRDYTSIGYLNLFGRYNNGPQIPTDFTGLFGTNDNTFIADDGNNMNALYKTNIPIPLTKRYSPNDDLEPGATYTIDVLGGTAANNPFSGKFASVESTDTIEKGFSFKVANITVGDTGYEGGNFVTGTGGFHANTRLIKGTTYTKFAYGSVYYDNGQIVNNNAMQYVIQKIQNFASIAALGPLTPVSMTDPISSSIVVVLENWHSDPTSSETAAIQIRNQLNALVDEELKARDSTYSRGADTDDFEVEVFNLV